MTDLYGRYGPPPTHAAHVGELRLVVGLLSRIVRGEWPTSMSYGEVAHLPEHDATARELVALAMYGEGWL